MGRRVVRVIDSPEWFGRGLQAVELEGQNCQGGAKAQLSYYFGQFWGA